MTASLQLKFEVERLKEVLFSPLIILYSLNLIINQLSPLLGLGSLWHFCAFEQSFGRCDKVKLSAKFTQNMLCHRKSVDIYYVPLVKEI